MKKILIAVGSVMLIASHLAAAKVAHGKEKSLAQTSASPLAAYATGTAFSSNKESFKIMPGVFATKSNAQSANRPIPLVASTNVKVLAEKAGFTIITNENQTVSAQNTSSTQALVAPATGNKLVAYNTRTKQAGIIMGTIIVHYQHGVNVKDALSNAPVVVLGDFNSIRFAYIRPNTLTDIVAVAEEVSKIEGIISADIEVLENENRLH